MTEPEGPKYADASLAASARVMREVFVALTREGFTAAQALELVKAMLPKASS
jgi:hypothetical protein